MIITERHPLDGVLADWGHLTRRVRAQTIDEDAYRVIAARIRADLSEIDAALAHKIGAVLDRLEQIEETGRMTLALFEAATAEVREALTVRRFNAKPAFVLIQGGLSTHVQQGA